MKVAVINFSGNVGKTTVAAHMLKPRMVDSPIYSVESINLDAASDGVDVEKIKGRKFGELINQLIHHDSAIIDVGASNVEDFLKCMQQHAGSHEEFDYFVIPTVKEKKQQADTVNTIRALSKIGVPSLKIRVLFNKVDTDEAVHEEFAPLFGLAEAEKSFTLNPEATVYSNEVFDSLKSVGKSLGDVSSDPVDYRTKFRDERATMSPEESEYCVQMIALKRLAITANTNLDQAYKAVFA